MFTGIIEEVGRVLAIDVSSPLDGIRIAAGRVLEDAKQGDSIAVNGTCLTITQLNAESFSVGVVAETLRRTNLGKLSPGDTVNLERPLQPASRLGGHFVQGHVDGTGRVAEVVAEGNALNVRVESEPNIMRYVVEKAFIAIDGASLTVTAVDRAGFGVSLIPYTQMNTASNLQTPGAEVNLEVDILAKYVEKLVVH